MPDHLGDDMRKVKNDEKEEEIKCLYSVKFLNIFRQFFLNEFFYLQLSTKAILNC